MITLCISCQSKCLEGKEEIKWSDKVVVRGITFLQEDPNWHVILDKAGKFVRVREVQEVDVIIVMMLRNPKGLNK